MIPEVLILIFIPVICGQGWITPSEIIYALADDNFLDINCTIQLNETNGLNSSALNFHGKDCRLDQSCITVINETTIQMKIKKTPSVNVYTCTLNRSGFEKEIDNTTVYIGYPPFNVTNFKCISDNWQKMICSFTEKDNPIPTKYIVEYRPLDWVRSPNEINLDSTKKTKFRIKKYLPTVEKYIFKIVASNFFGENAQTFEIDHYANVRPKEPLNVISSNITSHSVVINWELSSKLVHFPRGFIHEVSIMTEYNKTLWEEVGLRNLKKFKESSPRYQLLIDNLKYGNTLYDIKIRLRVDTADNKKKKIWSNNSMLQFRTHSRIPDTPPDTDFGGFYINDHNDIFLYWKPLPVEKQNGKNFGYIITELKENGHVVNIPETSLKSKIMAKYKTMRDNEYEFTIHSSNSEGLSEKGSVIKVPPRAKRPGEPTKLKKILKNGEYELSWRQPVRSAIPIESYTVFWCVSKSESPNQCETSIDFRRVNASTFDFKLVTNDVINFAVSANSFNSSSGMIWALCTAADGNDIGKLKTIWIPKMEATFMEIQWKLECVDSSIVVGYNLTYCPITSPKNLTCQSGTEKSLDIVGITHYNLTGLSPYTTYKTMISMFSKTRHGPPSEPLVKTTLEAAPSPPLNLVARDVRNTSMELYWDAPANLNGVLMFYEIWYNNQFKKYNDNDIREKATLNFKLEDLKSFTEYKIIVKACTIECSMNSNSIDIKTKIGVPGHVKFQHSEYLGMGTLIVWQPPLEPAGYLDYYEIRIVDENQAEKFFQLNDTGCWLDASCNFTSGKYFRTSLRAVNVIYSSNEEHIVLDNNDTKRISANNNRSIIDFQTCCKINPKLQSWIKIYKDSDHLHGKWSISYSYENVQSYLFVIISGVLLLLLIFPIIHFWRKICDFKLKYMADIKVEMPDGLKDITNSYCVENSKHFDGLLNPCPTNESSGDSRIPFQRMTSMDSNFSTETVESFLSCSSNIEPIEEMEENEAFVCPLQLQVTDPEDYFGETSTNGAPENYPQTCIKEDEPKSMIIAPSNYVSWRS